MVVAVEARLAARFAKVKTLAAGAAVWVAVAVRVAKEEGEVARAARGKHCTPCTCTGYSWLQYCWGTSQSTSRM